MFDLQKKLVVQTSVGVVVMSDESIGLQAKIIYVASQAIFTQCYAHAFNLVLSHAYTF